jgi:hypothetical protein
VNPHKVEVVLVDDNCCEHLNYMHTEHRGSLGILTNVVRRRILTFFHADTPLPKDLNRSVVRVFDDNDDFPSNGCAFFLTLTSA